MKEAFQKATLLILITRRPRACDQLRELYENNADRPSRLNVTASLHDYAREIIYDNHVSFKNVQTIWTVSIR